jgi:hypothetical protein
VFSAGDNLPPLIEIVFQGSKNRSQRSMNRIMIHELEHYTDFVSDTKQVISNITTIHELQDSVRKARRIRVGVLAGEIGVLAASQFDTDAGFATIPLLLIWGSTEIRTWRIQRPYHNASFEVKANKAVKKHANSRVLHIAKTLPPSN